MRRDLRLLPLAGVVWAVALICVLLPPVAPWCALCAVIATPSAVGILWLRQRCRTVVTRGGIVVVIFAASASVALTGVLAAPGRDTATAWDGRVVEAVAEITSSATIGRDGRLWVEVQLTAIGPPGSAAPVSAPARIGVDPGPGFDLGAGIRATGEVAATDAGERSSVVIFASEAVVERPAQGILALAASIRAAFVERALRLPEPGGGLLPGLAVGDTSAVTAELNDDMRTSGLSHLTAVSGLTVELRGG